MLNQKIDVLSCGNVKQVVGVHLIESHLEEFFQFARQKARVIKDFLPAWGFSGSPLFADIAALRVVCDRAAEGTKQKRILWTFYESEKLKKNNKSELS